MRQVLFHIPLRADWLPEGVPLHLFLLAVGLVLALVCWILGRRARRPMLQEGLRGGAVWLAGAGVVSAVIVYVLVVRFGLSRVPIYGFGMMLFLAFLVCTWLAGRRAESEGVAKEHIQDLAIWLFIFGLIGARLTHLLTETRNFLNLSLWEKFLAFISIWDGGIVLYGSVIGALAGYAAVYLFLFRRHHLATLKLADIVAPSIAVGLCLGRFGCFLNGCCYGQIACPTCATYTVHFPLSAPAREGLVYQGYQTAAGFTLAREEDQPHEGARVGTVDPDSRAYANGLRPGDVIVAMNDKPIGSPDDLIHDLVDNWPRGATDLSLTVRPHKGAGEPESLPVFAPRTLGLYPTQLYEIVSMILMFLLLTVYYPFRRRDGQVIALLMVGYGVHRYLNELLRDDPRPKGFESYTSIILVVAGVALWVFLQTRPAQVRAELKEAKAG